MNFQCSLVVQNYIYYFFQNPIQRFFKNSSAHLDIIHCSPRAPVEKRDILHAAPPSQPRSCVDSFAFSHPEPLVSKDVPGVTVTGLGPETERVHA